LQPELNQSGIIMIIYKQLNADAQEPAYGAAQGAVRAQATATTTAPVAEPVVETAHDDFDWSVDKRNVKRT
jgi:small subunit ribosomal protein S1